MMKHFLLTFTISMLILSNALADQHREVRPGYKLNFPADIYYRKDFKVQWWYFTGHLTDEKGRKYGYELTFFVVGIQKRKYESRFGVDDIYVSHFALSDVDGDKFHYSEKADTGAYGFAGAESSELKVWVGDDILEGSVKEFHLTAHGEQNSIDLILIPAKPLVLHGEDGYSRKSEESPLTASYYFSFTRLTTRGSLTLDGKTRQVAGESWFDREMSSRGLAKNEAGWDWFSIQLVDGRDIMIYLLRHRDGSIDPFSAGTLVFRDGTYRHLSLNEFRVTVLDHYLSSRTGNRYPSKWQIEIPSENTKLIVTPLIKDQELTGSVATGPAYWEGTCKVGGTKKGRAYVELTGY